MTSPSIFNLYKNIPIYQVPKFPVNPLINIKRQKIKFQNTNFKDHNATDFFFNNYQFRFEDELKLII